MTYQVWYIHQDGRQYGPVTEQELRHLARNSKLDPDAHVWSAGLPQWRRARDLEGLYQPPPLPGAEPAEDDPDDIPGLSKVPPSSVPGAGRAPQPPSPDPDIRARREPRRTIPRPPADRTAASETSKAPVRPAGEPTPAPRDKADAGPRGETRPAPQGNSPPVVAGTKAVAVAPVPAEPDADAKEPANDNLLSVEEKAISRGLADRVSALEKAFEQEAIERRQLKTALESLIDFLSTEPDQVAAREAHTALPAEDAIDAPADDARPRDPGSDRERSERNARNRAEAFDAEIVEPPILAGPSDGAPANYLSAHWTGTHSLGKSFWLNAFFPSLILTLAGLVLYASLRHSDIWFEVGLIAGALAGLPVVLWSMTGLWRAAHRATAVAGSRIFPALAKAVMIGVLFVWLGLGVVLRFAPTLIPGDLLMMFDVGSYFSSVQGRAIDPGYRLQKQPAPPPIGPVPSRPA